MVVIDGENPCSFRGGCLAAIIDRPELKRRTEESISIAEENSGNFLPWLMNEC